MPLFTPQTARDFAIRAHAARRAATLARLNPPQMPDPQPAEAAELRTKAQVAKLDDEIDRAIDRRDWDALPALSAAKERLWKLVRPTAGSFKPGRVQRQARPEVQPTPTDPA